MARSSLHWRRANWNDTVGFVWCRREKSGIVQLQAEYYLTILHVGQQLNHKLLHWVPLPTSTCRRFKRGLEATWVLKRSTDRSHQLLTLKSVLDRGSWPPKLQSPAERSCSLVSFCAEKMLRWFFFVRFSHFQGPGNTIVKMKSWHKHCTKKSQVQEARWAPQNQIWGALPGKWCENDALDADWLNFQGVKFSIARIQENIEFQCASNLNNHGLTRSMLNWTSNMCKVVRMMEHSAPQSATLRKRPKNKSTSLESGPCHPVMTVSPCLEHPQCHEATLFCGLINCKSSMTWMTWQVSEIASLLFTIWILVSLGGIPYVKASETSRTGNSNSRSDRKFLSCWGVSAPW